MIFIHETHEIAGGKTEEFAEAMRTVWRPLLEEGGDARLLWYWELTHGTGASYQALSLTAVRDWAAWGARLARASDDARHRDWERRVWQLRKDVTAKVLLPTTWSPLREVDLAAPPAAPAVEQPALYLHDTGWPFPGKLEAYVEALGRVLHPQEARNRMLSIAACFTVAPGTGRHHEVLILQRIESWDRFAELLRRGEQGAQRGGWMEEGLQYRDRWESKLLRCAPWSPRQ
jgi:hypothetical protein